MNQKKIQIQLATLDDLFSTQEMRDDAKLERVQLLSLEMLHPFPEHPFQMANNAELEQLVDSIRQLGILNPGLARPLANGSYELISGHRRLAACQQLGLDTMPVIVRPMSDDEAVVAMVDANLQREHLLPSEKAFAYRMKRDALQHQGIASPQVGERHLTAERIGQPAGDSKNQVLRYIRLTYLIPELLKRVDDGKIAFNPAVELSYLTSEQQITLLDLMEQLDCTPSHAQAIQFKKMSQSGQLTPVEMQTLLAQPKANQREVLRLPTQELRPYFPKHYTNEQMKKDILKGLALLHRQRERNNQER